MSVCNGQMGAGTYKVLFNQDLFLRPWSGAPEWKSPDISAVNGSLVKGRINQVRVTIHKASGTDETKNIRVSVKWAPWNVGLDGLAFREESPVDIEAFNGPTLDVTLTVDLRNLGETNGGAWPSPISEFDHFCVAARVDFTSDLGPGAKQDVNLSNNEARTNFAAVATNLITMRECFLVANPDSLGTSTHDRLSLEIIPPKGAVVRLLGWPGKFGRGFSLKPGEVRVVCMEIRFPRSTWGNRSQRKLLSVGLRRGRTLHSGIALQVGRKPGIKG